MPLSVPLSLSGVVPGLYTLAIRAEDSAGRVSSTQHPVAVLAPLPPPAWAGPSARQAVVTLRWTLPAGGAAGADMVEIHRTGPDGSRVVARLEPGTTSYSDQVAQSGEYSYTIVLVTAGGRRAASPPWQVQVDLTPPTLGAISLSPVDGAGLHMRWEPARDAETGIAGYRVILLDGRGHREALDLPAEASSAAQPLPPGNYQAILLALDRAGNATETPAMPFRVQPGAVALISRGRFQPVDVPGFVENGVTWVPLRLFGEAMNCQVLWDGANQMATILDPVSGRVVIAMVGRPLLQVVDGSGPRQITLQVAPRMTGGRVLVPLRALAEALGARVQWHQATQMVEILTE